MTLAEKLKSMLNMIVGAFIVFVTLSIPYGVGKLINKLVIKSHSEEKIHGNIFVGCFSLLIGAMGLFILYNLGKAITCNVSW